jgi:rod shape determining protein RodA
MKVLKIANGHIDWILFFATIPILIAGLITMRSLGSDSNYFFHRQLIWAGVSFAAFFTFSFIDWRFLRKGELLAFLWLIIVAVLAILLMVAEPTRGAASWFKIGSVAIEPADPAKLLVILVLAKYFSRRHIEIANIKHIIVSAVYVGIPAFLIFLQPDFGSTVIFFAIWLGMVMASGINKKHLLILFLILVITSCFLWGFIFKPYQKTRIISFLDPMQDIRGAGYNAAQSMIAVGSGRIFGKGIGYGTQSRLEFLPEHQTDFIFAAFAEEWGLIGVSFLFFFYLVIIWRILKIAALGESNFESLYGVGLAFFLIAHFVVNVGMNIGLFPITGTPLPFLSYGGTYLLTVYSGMGILMGMKRYSRSSHHEDIHKDITAEFLGG